MLRGDTPADVSARVSVRAQAHHESRGAGSAHRHCSANVDLIVEAGGK
jgi:hypothetical protein